VNNLGTEHGVWPWYVRVVAKWYKNSSSLDWRQYLSVQGFSSGVFSARAWHVFVKRSRRSRRFQSLLNIPIRIALYSERYHPNFANMCPITALIFSDDANDSMMSIDTRPATRVNVELQVFRDRPSGNKPLGEISFEFSWSSQSSELGGWNVVL